MENIIKQQNERIFYLDFLRAISTIAVIVMHTGAEKSGGISVSQYNTIRYMLADWCVPIFLMITGSLFLNVMDCSFQRVFKHIKKTVLILIFWGFIYNFLSLTIIEGLSISTIVNSLKMIIFADTTYCYQFWYLYALIPMYFLLPVFKSFVKNANDKDSTIVVLLFFIFTIVIPSIVKYTGDFGATSLINKFSLFNTLFFYMLLGAYLNRIDVKKSVGIILFVVSVIVFAVTSICSILSVNISFDKLCGYNSLYTCVVASWIYLFAKMKNNYSKNIMKFFGIISKYSLGIYVLHVIVIQMLRKIIHLDTGFAPVLISVPVIVLVVFLISLVGTVIVKKIPILKNTL